MAGQKGGWLPQKASFCEVDQSNVLLLTLKRAEGGDEVILRLVEMEGRDTMVSVAAPLLSICQAYETNLVEENQRLLSFSQQEVKASLKPFGITTIRLQAEGSTGLSSIWMLGWLPFEAWKEYSYAWAWYGTDRRRGEEGTAGGP
jgi:hypothetical protein